MDQASKNYALEILDSATNVTLATIRPDGYPQVTVVNYIHEGLFIYIGVGKDSQKVKNIQHSNKVSLAVNADFTDWTHVHGLSLGGEAEMVTDAAEAARIEASMDVKFPDMHEWVHSDARHTVVFIKIRPQVISLLNYEKGVGHADLALV
jgi:nitroimidazol reductase NimA-like FMN-containing flavoprotein (pyridoxamine 5'-phosphate oxidase superfamily)